MLLLMVFSVTFVLNIPFGWFRGGVRKLSKQWFFYVHAPIPVIIAVRILSGISWKFAPVLIFIAVVGQYVGERLRRVYGVS